MVSPLGSSLLAHCPSRQRLASARRAGGLWQQPREGARAQAGHKSLAVCVSPGSDLGGAEINRLFV